MKSKMFLFFTIVLTSLSVFSQSNLVSASEFQKSVGKWKGTLIYLDYKTSKPYEMPADLEVIQSNELNQFKFNNFYPNETSANSSHTIAITDDGKKLNDELVKSNKKLSDGSLEIITEILGKDGNDNASALIRHTYLIGAKTFEIKKEVQFTGTKIWLLRHTYKYSKV
ncbi:hypothetical protein [Flavobacterium reichenbachii]|uniref:Lipid/polyisoprenoid-binding YceI-like domain-containing protein n=1 Tax=Flavobacterium reichenbachii TaxID=362418 RepID=A0A085ZPP2_9FLAO|nr:hypothetical protein [Flavobacterium reichenbachii]KFF06406.1 hypothetical protein IW19_13185 [Flavobacterium reichenbachii]OXB14612.1 hypothetical protein B0A68_12290 [Flavobacterium reichenbachii]